MARLRGAWGWILAGALCAAGGCVSQSEYDAIARANLQLQDKLAASQADRVKARTQVALLRQELVQAKQDQQEANHRLQAVTIESESLRARLHEQDSPSGHAAPQTQPAATRPAP
jgi:chromosome segregation ATPase